MVKAIAIIEIPVVSRCTPTSTPTAHMPDTGHCRQINMPSATEITPLISIHTQPDTGR